MGSYFDVSKWSTTSNEVVYKWVRDDESTGYVVVDNNAEVIRPCDQDGHIQGDMLVRRSVGNVENPDARNRRKFVSVAAAIFAEWEKAGHFPDKISRDFG